MAWFWTDELAHMLIEQTEVDPRSVESGIRRPFAVHAVDGTDMMTVARRVFHLEGEEEEVAGAA